MSWYINRLHWQRSKSLAEPFSSSFSSSTRLQHVSLNLYTPAFKWSLVWQVGFSHATPQPGFSTPATPALTELLLHTFIVFDRCGIKLHCKSMPLQGQFYMSLWKWELQVDWSKHLSLCYDSIFYHSAQSDTVFPPIVQPDFAIDFQTCSLKNWPAYEHFSLTIECASLALSMLQLQTSQTTIIVQSMQLIEPAYFGYYPSAFQSMFTELQTSLTTIIEQPMILFIELPSFLIHIQSLDYPAAAKEPCCCAITVWCRFVH